MAKIRTPQYIKTMRLKGETPKSAKAPKVVHTQSLVRLAFEILGGLLALMNVYTWFAPTILILPGDIQKGRSLSAPFTITNTSTLLSIENVDTACHINYYKGGSTLRGVNGGGFSPMNKELASLESSSIYCRIGIEDLNDTRQADVVITATYRPALAWFRERTTRRFITTIDDSGKAKWIPYALNEVAPFDEETKPY